MTKFTNTALFILASLSSACAFSAVPKTGQRLVSLVVAVTGVVCLWLLHCSRKSTNDSEAFFTHSLQRTAFVFVFPICLFQD